MTKINKIIILFAYICDFKNVTQFAVEQGGESPIPLRS